jgi:phosphohistidine phosphatase
MTHDRPIARRLIIVRHAVAAQDAPGGGGDRERQLTERGEEDARAAGRRLLAADIGVDRILCSPAARTRATAQLIAEVIGVVPGCIDYEPAIYNAGRDQLLDLIAGVPTEVNRLMLVGHNPGLSDLADALSPEPMPGLPTSGIAVVDLALTEWHDLSAEHSALAYQFLTPGA